MIHKKPSAVSELNAHLLLGMPPHGENDLAFEHFRGSLRLCLKLWIRSLHLCNSVSAVFELEGGGPALHSMFRCLRMSVTNEIIHPQ